jgi:hypothetical protein
MYRYLEEYVLVCPAPSTWAPEESYACECGKVIGFGTRTKRNMKQPELLSEENERADCGSIAHVSVRTFDI